MSEEKPAEYCPCYAATGNYQCEPNGTCRPGSQEPLTKERFMEIHNIETDEFGQPLRECYSCDRVGCSGCAPNTDLRERIVSALVRLIPVDKSPDVDAIRLANIADAVMAVVQPFVDNLLAQAEAAIERVKALHQPNEMGECACGESCDPCATIKTLEGEE